MKCSMKDERLVIGALLYTSISTHSLFWSSALVEREVGWTLALLGGFSSETAGTMVSC